MQLRHICKFIILNLLLVLGGCFDDSCNNKIDADSCDGPVARLCNHTDNGNHWETVDCSQFSDTPHCVVDRSESPNRAACSGLSQLVEECKEPGTIAVCIDSKSYSCIRYGAVLDVNEVCN